MAWTTPKTDWATGELVTAEDMNAVGENLAALKNLSTAAYTTTENIQLTSRDFADVDSDNLNLTITTEGGDVLVHFHGPVYVPRISAYFDVEVDGTRQGGDDGLGRVYGRDSLRTIVNFTCLIQGLSAGSHTFKLKCRTTAAVDLGPSAQFWVREI